MKKHASTITTYPIAGENEVDKVRYTVPGEAGSSLGLVWINREKYFEGVPPEAWNFHVGGDQVCQKWLKVRKGRKLTYDDLTHYQHMVSALNETIRVMAEIEGQSKSMVAGRSPDSVGNPCWFDLATSHSINKKLDALFARVLGSNQAPGPVVPFRRLSWTETTQNCKRRLPLDCWKKAPGRR